MDEKERAELLKEHLDSILSEFHFDDFVNKWGFMDGEMLAKEARPVIEQLIDDIVEHAPIIEGFTPIAMRTSTHNPCYIVFEKEGEDEFIRYGEFDDPLLELKIKKVLEPIIKQEITNTRKKLDLE